MSVFVKDIDVPSDCDGCWHPTCNLWLQTDVGKRHKDCPISPMPEKHGNLIDETPLIKYFLANKYEKFVGGYVAMMLMTTPTIVEAEGDI